MSILAFAFFVLVAVTLSAGVESTREVMRDESDSKTAPRSLSFAEKFHAHENSQRSMKFANSPRMTRTQKPVLGALVHVASVRGAQRMTKQTAVQPQR